MAITFSGLATGLDTDSIVSSLMEIERAPITRLEAKREAATERLNAYNQFKGFLEELKTSAQAISLTSQVKNYTATVGDEGYFTATATGATPGSYDIAVAQLAKVQKTVSDGWTSKSDGLLGTGTFTIGTTDIQITEDNNSLEGLMREINDRSDELGVTASIINDGSASPYRLVLTGTDTSTSFTVSSNLTDDLSNPVAFNTTDTSAAQQAKIYVDGIEIVSDTNTISDAISGLTLDLEAVSPVTSEGPPVEYQTTTLKIEQDTAPVKEKITAFVSSYNRVMDWILSGYEEFGNVPETTTDGTTDSEELLGSVLRGDGTIQGIKRGLQNILTSVVEDAGGISSLGQIGITTQLNGKLNLDTATMEDAVDANPEDIVTLLAGNDTSDGIMKQFNYYLGELTLGSDSFYQVKKESYDATVNRIDDQIALLEPRLDKREAAIRAQFSAMENLVSSLNAQSEFLLQQFNSDSGN